MKLIQHGQLDGSVEASVSFLDSWGQDQEAAARQDVLSGLQDIGRELSYVGSGLGGKLTQLDVEDAKRLCTEAAETLRGLSA